MHKTLHFYLKIQNIFFGEGHIHPAREKTLLPTLYPDSLNFSVNSHSVIWLLFVFLFLFLFVPA